MIEIRDGVKFKLMFFGGEDLPSGGQVDVMGAILQKDGGPWELIYRLRRSVDDNPWNQDDEKRWFSSKIKAGANIDDVVADMVGTMRAGMFPCKLESVGVFSKGDPAEVHDWLTKQPWAHMKTVDKAGQA
jgi:hypothetical protein